MAQVGRISGPLLFANLERNGIDLAFRNDLSTTQLLYIDVNNNRIGVNLNNPTVELQIFGTTRTVDLIADTATIGDFDFVSNNINAKVGSLYLNAKEAIRLSNLETSDYYITDNQIRTNNSNANIDLVPHGTGTVIMGNGFLGDSTLDTAPDLKIYGNLYTPGNLTFDGNIIFGDDSTVDTVGFNSDINSNIDPDADRLFNIGSYEKRWQNLFTELVNGQVVITATVLGGGVDLGRSYGNVYYVAVNGDDTSRGDNPYGALATIKEALARADGSTQGPVTIYVYPGVYQEALPLVMPEYTSIIGLDARNTIVVPDTSSQSEDVFHLKDSCTVQTLTIKDFYYDNLNNTGYAFRYASNSVISNRSPYVKDVTVITQGTTTSASDPRGFASGDAGKGAWIDGSELNSASVEASMLFHSATFITPGVDAITMTNGVRVEWLNSFTYFANRGLYVKDGVTGRTSYDGSTVEYGAEIRSIGSANVYGNIGIEADGPDSLAYLIQHNFGYIGSGKDSENDKSLAVQADEVIETNNGQVHYVTTDHLGAFRVGDNFFVDFETGNTSINLDSFAIDQLTGLRIVSGADETIIDGAFISTGNIRIRDNDIESLAGDLEINSATNTINLNANTNITNNLSIVGNLSFDGSLSVIGNQVTDTVDFNVDFDQNFNPKVDTTHDLGSSTKFWNGVNSSQATINSITIIDNTIITNDSNADLELRANGTGDVLFEQSNLQIDNDFTVVGLSDFQGQVSQSGAFSASGGFSLGGGLDVIGNVSLTQQLNTSSVRFEDIEINDNYITTTSSNSDLELRASGTGNIIFNDTVNLNGSLFVDNITNTNIIVANNITTSKVTASSVDIDDNFITTNASNADLELRATGDINVDSNDVQIAQDLTVNGTTDLQGTNITGTITHVGNKTQTGNLDIAGEISNGNILIEDNFISTTVTNSDLELRANGTGIINIGNNDVVVEQDLTVNSSTPGSNIVYDVNFNSTPDRFTIISSLNDEGLVDRIDFRKNFDEDDAWTEFVTYALSLPVGTQFTLTNLAYGDTPPEADSITLELTNVFTSGGSSSIESVSPTVISTDADLINEGALYNSTISQVIFPPPPAETSLKNISINGTLTHTGDRTQTGDYSVTNLTITKDLISDSQAQFEEILFDGNVIKTTTTNADLELRASGLGNVILQENTIVNNNLFASRLFTGNITVLQDLDLNDIVIPPSIIEINDNYLTTNVSNADLDLRANGTGLVLIPDNNVQVDEGFTVLGSTDLQDLTITNLVTHTGDTNQVGNYNSIGDFRAESITISDSADLHAIKINQNYIETTESNADLELRASGTGDILVDTNLNIPNNLSARNLYTDNIVINDSVALEEFESSSDIKVFDNVITTTNSNSNLELRAIGTGSVYLQNLEIHDGSIETTASIDSSLPTITFDVTDVLDITGTGAVKLPVGDISQRNGVTGEIRFNSEQQIFEGYSTTNIGLGGVRSSDNKTSVTAHPTNNTIIFTVNNSIVGTADITGLNLNGLQVEDILINSNEIKTNVTNSDLELVADGTGALITDAIRLKGNTISNIGMEDSTVNNNIRIGGTGKQYVQFVGDHAVKFPSGDTLSRPQFPALGQTRHNTDTNELETWIGTEWKSSAGQFDNISAEEMENEAFIQTLIYG